MVYKIQSEVQYGSGAESKNFQIESLTADPTASLFTGRLYYNSTSNKLRVYNGSAWVDASPQSGAMTTTFTASQITDFTTAVNNAVAAYVDSAAGSRENLDTIAEIVTLVATNQTALTTATRTFKGTIGDGSSTSISVTHSLNTRDVTVSVREAASPYAQVLVASEATSINAVTLDFATAPSNGQYRVLVLGN